MSLHPFYHFLKDRLTGSLPGRDAQLKMAPSPSDGRHFPYNNPTENAFNSSVLIPVVYDKFEELHIILTVRTDSIAHGGQISFPGGRADMNESIIHTALRETEEEIGITQEKITVAGSLSRLYLDRSNNLITPVIGFIPELPKLKPNPAEVSEAFTVSVKTLLEESNIIREQWKLRDREFEVPYWNIHKVPLWGATAMMMSEFLELYKEFEGF
jgi:8-oxo-dGTP pyrophosphatase MutT (NUDIX family)